MEFLAIIAVGVALWVYSDWRARQRRARFALGLKIAFQAEFPECANSFTEPVCARIGQVFEYDKEFQKLKKQQKRPFKKWKRKIPDDTKLVDFTKDQQIVAGEKFMIDDQLTSKILSWCPMAVRDKLQQPSLDLNRKMMDVVNQALAYTSLHID